MQLAVIEYARNVAGITDATSTEFNRSTKSPLIGLITEWLDERGEVQQRSVDSILAVPYAGAQKSELVRVPRLLKCMVRMKLSNVTVTVTR